MVTIQCDCCSQTIKSSSQIQLMNHLLAVYSKLENPDLCSNCINDLEKAIHETIIQWKVAAGHKKL